MLDWDNNTEADLAGYNVYRSLRPGSDHIRVSQSLLADSEYVDAGVVEGTTYYYVATAEDILGYESAYSDEVSASLGIQPVMKLLAGIGVKTVGADVSRWEDQAGSNHAEQQMTADQPELIPSAINGEPAIEFDGTGEHMDVANSTDINVGGPYPAKTLVVVFKTGGDVISRQVIWEQGGDTRGLKRLSGQRQPVCQRMEPAGGAVAGNSPDPCFREHHLCGDISNGRLRRRIRRICQRREHRQCGQRHLAIRSLRRFCSRTCGRKDEVP